MKRNIVQLNESDLREIIRSAINEISYGTIKNAYDKVEYTRNENDEFAVNFWHIEEALDTLLDALHVYDTSNSPKAAQFIRCLYEMRKFFARKNAQQKNFETGMENKYKQTEQEIVKYANNFGYQGNTWNEVTRQMTDDEFENFMDSLPDELRTFAEDELP